MVLGASGRRLPAAFDDNSKDGTSGGGTLLVLLWHFAGRARSCGKGSLVRAQGVVELLLARLGCEFCLVVRKVIGSCGTSPRC